MRAHPLNDEACGLASLVGGAFPVEVGRRETLGTVKGELTVTPQSPGGLSKPLKVADEARGLSAARGLEHLGDIRHARRVRADGPQQPLAGKLDDLLRFPDYIRPAAVLMQNIYRP